LAQVQREVTEPKLSSVFPLGGRRGTNAQVEVRGNLLAGAYAVWFDSGGLSGRVLKVEEVKEEVKEKASSYQKKPEKPPVVYRALIDVEIQPTAPLEIYSLRLVSPRGISDAVPFRVVNEPVVVETANPHQTVRQAQPVNFPAIINGKLEKPGELDFYSFHAKQGQELTFEVVSSQNCDPRLALYPQGGSWFGPERPTRLLMKEERTSDLMPLEARGTYRILEAGEYFLEVSSLFGKGTPNSSYQVWIAFREQSPRYEAQSEQPPGEWPERSFSRKLNDNWMTNLEARAVEAGDESTTQAKGGSSTQGSGVDSGAERGPKKVLRLPSCPSSVAEREPNDRAAQAQDISVPAVIEGTIEPPGDVDNFKFKVEPGQKLALEIETPDAKPPYFNPRLGIVDSQDHELFSNVERRLSMFNNNADPQVYLKSVEPKAIYTFERGGEYVLQIRDVTSRYGNPSYRYRILLRPEIPHVGEVSVEDGDRINLSRGEPKRLTITASYEEGFTGDLSFTFTGLPEGVQAFPAVQFNDGRAPLEVTVNPDVIAPKPQKTTIVLLASPEAPLTSKPMIVQLHCHPIAKGRLGPNLLVREIPLMVVEGSQQKEEKPQ